MMNHIYVEVSKYINQVKKVENADSIIKDLLRPSPRDIFRKIKNNITIVDDWLTYTENKFKYVEAAVFEDRQFIREEGEVLPIERVKKISPASTRHLARHSDYIEKVTDENDVIPSKLYTISKDTDYGVYENKFLYLLLITIRDFITREREDIDQVLKSVNGQLELSRESDLADDNIKLEIKIQYRSLNPVSKLYEIEKVKLDRMEQLGAKVTALLQTPLMLVVAKEPVISSVITKTNVLTMNENFSNSLELYDYLIEYDKQAYKIEQTSENVAIGKNIACCLLALEFMTHAYKDSLTEDYERQKNAIESQQRQNDIELIEDRLARLKEEYQKDPATYIAVLLDKIKLLEDQNSEIVVLKKDLVDLLKKNESLNTANNSLIEEIKTLEKKIADLVFANNNFENDKNSIKAEYEKKLIEKNNEIEKLNTNIEALNSNIAKLESEKMNFSSLKDSLMVQIEEERQKNSDIIKEYEQKLASMNEALEKANNDYHLLSARVIADDALNNKIFVKDASTSEEAFNELERDYNAFTDYYEKVWKKTKKEIIKEIKRKKG